MWSIRENFRLNNWHKTIFLTNCCVSCQSPSILFNGLLGRTSILNFKHSSPFCKSAAKLIELLSHFTKRIKSFGEVLFFWIKYSKSLVDLNSRHNSHRSNMSYKIDTFISGLLCCFFLKNDSRNELVDSR